MIKLIASDMDGTLLDEHSQVPEETYELIVRLREHGVRFVANSGRRIATLKWMFEPIQDQMDFIGSLGAEVEADGVLIGREVFSYSAVLRLHRICQEIPCLHLALYTEDRCFLLDDQTSFTRELDKDLPNAERMFDPPGPAVNLIKASVCVEAHEQLMDMTYILERELGDAFMFMPSGERWIDVTPRHINKATALAQLLRYYGLSRDELAAFGDSLNDYMMLRYAGHPYIMGNARFAVRQLPGTLIGKNTEQAVQHELRKFLEELES